MINFKKQYRVELAKTLTGHYYSVWEKKKFLGHFPSVTTYLNAFPTSEQLVKWVAEQGFHESRQIRDAAGRAGTKIHLAVEDLIAGAEICEENFTTEEWVKIVSFVNWHTECKPEVIATEVPIFSRKKKYAGRIDCVAKIAGEVYVIDWKSSRSIHDSAILQVAAYANALEEMTDIIVASTSIVQLGASNKNGYRFVTYKDWRKDYKVFEHIRGVWEFALCPKEPPVLELPSKLRLEIKK